MKEFSEEEYFMAENLGMKRVLEDEKMFNGVCVEFASILWDTTEGNIILYRMSKFNIHSVNIFFTSNIIREQISKLQKSR